MSITATQWALYEAPIATTQSHSRDQVVLIALADRYNDDTQVAWPSIGNLAKKLKRSPDSIRRALKSLESQGLISRGNPAFISHLPEYRRPTVWHLHLEKTHESTEPEKPSSSTPRNPATPPCRPSSTGATPPPSKPARGTSRTPAQQNQIETKVETKGRKSASSQSENTPVADAESTPSKTSEELNAALDALAAGAASAAQRTFPDHCEAHRHIEEPGACHGCRRQRERRQEMLADALQKRAEASRNLRAGIDDCETCDHLGYREEINPRTGIARSVVCSHTEADAQADAEAKGVMA